MIALTLPPDVEKRICAAAERSGQSAAKLIEEAILEHLDTLEDLAGAERALNEIRRGQSSTTILAEWSASLA